MRIYGWWVLLQSWRTMRFSEHRRLSPESGRTVPEDRLGEQERMIQLDEYLTKKGHDNMVAKITKKIGESPRNSWRNCRTGTGKTWKTKLKKIVGSELKDIEVSFQQGLSFPIQKNRHKWTPRSVWTSGTGQKKSRNTAARRSSDGNRSERFCCQVTTCASVERLECVFCTISVLAGWSRVWTASRLFITGSSPRLQRLIPRSASGARPKSPQRNQMTRDWSSSTILNDS